MKSFRNLKVWEKAHQFTLAIYKASADFPQEERYGLTTQMRRAVVSIPSNIAEGCARSGDKEMARFLQIAMGSASELEYQLLLTRDLNFLDDQQHRTLETKLVEIKKMLTSLIFKLKANG